MTPTDAYRALALNRDQLPRADEQTLHPSDAERVLHQLASVFLSDSNRAQPCSATPLPSVEDKYRALVEQIPAVLFMASLDQGMHEAYVSPHIEAALGYSQHEWLDDPLLWYRHLHPEDKQRWSFDAAEMLISGKPLRSTYRVIARDGRVIWLQCEAQTMRQEDGRPWFIHGVAFDVTDLKQTEKALEEQRNLLSAILDTVSALVLVLDPQGRIVRLNRAGEQMTGYSHADVKGCYLWDVFVPSEDSKYLQELVRDLANTQTKAEHESRWLTRDGGHRLISWSGTVLPGGDSAPAYLIVTGRDITERKRLERGLLEISNREQQRIAQDLHDDLGQHLTGIAFLSKVLQEKWAGGNLPEAQEAATIVRLVNEAIDKTRRLAHGLLPVTPEPVGLMSALRQWASEVEERFGIICRFECRTPVLLQDSEVATHLYRICQEAVNNAIKHGDPAHVRIVLQLDCGRGVLTIADDGHGTKTAISGTGMGMHIMSYRAKMIGGTLEVHNATPSGTIVTCRFPIGLEK